jgi:ketosteroid isomerase-like protein
MAILLLACASPSVAFAQREADIRSKIVALENVWNRAAEVSDIDALDAILDDAFVYVAPDGRLMTKVDVLADVKASHGIRVTSEVMVVNLHGDTAIVTGIYTIKGTAHGRLFVRRSRFVDTWRSKSGVWVSIASLATPIVS